MKQTVEFLLQVKRLETLISRKEAEIARLQDVATRVTSAPQTVSVDGAPMGMERVQSSRTIHDSMGEAACAIADAEVELAELVRRYGQVISDVSRTIEQLDLREYEILHRRYIEGQTIGETAASMDLSESAIEKGQRSAQKSLAAILEEAGVA